MYARSSIYRVCKSCDDSLRFSRYRKASTSKRSESRGRDRQHASSSRIFRTVRPWRPFTLSSHHSVSPVAFSYLLREQSRSWKCPTLVLQPRRGVGCSTSSSAEACSTSRRRLLRSGTALATFEVRPVPRQLLSSRRLVPERRRRRRQRRPYRERLSLSRTSISSRLRHVSKLPMDISMVSASLESRPNRIPIIQAEPSAWGTVSSDSELPKMPLAAKLLSMARFSTVTDSRFASLNEELRPTPPRQRPRLVVSTKRRRRFSSRTCRSRLLGKSSDNCSGLHRHLSRSLTERTWLTVRSFVQRLWST